MEKLSLTFGSEKFTVIQNDAGDYYLTHKNKVRALTPGAVIVGLSRGPKAMVMHALTAAAFDADVYDVRERHEWDGDNSLSKKSKPNQPTNATKYKSTILERL